MSAPDSDNHIHLAFAPCIRSDCSESTFNTCTSLFTTYCKLQGHKIQSTNGATLSVVARCNFLLGLMEQFPVYKSRDCLRLANVRLLQSLGPLPCHTIFTQTCNSPCCRVMGGSFNDCRLPSYPVPDGCTALQDKGKSKCKRYAKIQTYPSF